MRKTLFWLNALILLVPVLVSLASLAEWSFKLAVFAVLGLPLGLAMFALSKSPRRAWMFVAVVANALFAVALVVLIGIAVVFNFGGTLGPAMLLIPQLLLTLTNATVLTTALLRSRAVKQV